MKDSLNSKVNYINLVDENQFKTWENIIFDLNTEELFYKNSLLDPDYDSKLNQFFIGIIDEVVKYFYENIILGRKLEGKCLILVLFKVEYYTIHKIKHLPNSHFLSQHTNILTLGFKQELLYDSNIHTSYENYKDLESLILSYYEFWSYYMEQYDFILPVKVHLHFKIIQEEKVQELSPDKKMESKIHNLEEKDISLADSPEIKAKKENKSKFSDYKIPSTMDFTKWGICKISNDFTTATVRKINKDKTYSTITYFIKINDLNIEVDVKIKDKVIFSFVDTLQINDNLISKDLSFFKRTIKNKTFYFDNGKRVINLLGKTNTKFIAPLKESYFRSNKFITLDLETKIVDKKMYPYCASIYDGNLKEYKTFYITDYITSYITIDEQSNALLKDCVLYLLTPKYADYKIYVHNFSYFDGIFLMKIFSELDCGIKPIIRDGRFIETRIYYDLIPKKAKVEIDLLNKEFSTEDESENIIDKTNSLNKINSFSKTYRHSIAFRDSYLLLPSSLDALGKTFGSSYKDIFPYEFVNLESTNLDYKGKCPEYKYFVDDKVSLDEYKEYSKRFENSIWDLKKETIFYCENDSKVLFEVLEEFSKFIFNNWNVDIMLTPTISSLAFRIFRTKYLTNEMQIPILNGPIYEDIKKGYTGGAVDVYKPYGENITVYDVKSLYPSVMLKNEVPVGKPKYFEGNILDTWNLLSSQEYDKPFGFFYCKITTPKQMYAPILQTKQKINNLNKSIAPLGTWKGWYFSEELYNAKKYGYDYTIEKGYLFEKKFLFKDYVTTLYKIKEENKKGSPLSLIAKLLLNSLYGRFGMSPDDENHIITSKELAEYFELDDNYKIIDIIDFKNNKQLISYKIDQAENNSFKNISIGIAAAVTFYGRIHMSQFKNDSSLGNLLYSDTDCIAISGSLPDKHLGKQLGQMEVEKSYKKVIYIAPKVYVGLNNNDELKAKIKGVKNINKYKNITNKIPGFTFDNILKLLTRNKEDSKFLIDQVKWNRVVKEGTIKVSEDTYTLMVTGNKRNLVYENDIYVNTEPLVIEKDLENTNNLEDTTNN